MASNFDWSSYKLDQNSIVSWITVRVRVSVRVGVRR